jgi:AcrR family transcriptional regulator
MVQKRKAPAKAGPARSVKAAPAAAAPAAKRRGRPRAYEPEVALARALDVFWKDGFAATSLDDLSAATGMNRPSLYGAFGDKRELYIKSYQSYRDRARLRMGEVFSAELPLRTLLERVYGIALDMYLSGEDGPRGCFTVMTATSEAVYDPDIRKLVLSGLTEMDRFFALLFKAAQARGEVAPTANPDVLAQLASATIHTIAIRARAQVPRKELEAIVKGAIEVMCGA